MSTLAPEDVVFTMPVNITRQKLQEFVDSVNKLILDDDDTQLTMDKVLTTPDLLTYICREAIEDNTAMYDEYEFINNDGWCDIRDYM